MAGQHKNKKSSGVAAAKRMAKKRKNKKRGRK